MTGGNLIEENAVQRWNATRRAMAPSALRSAFGESSPILKRIGDTLAIQGRISFVPNLSEIVLDCRGVTALAIDSPGGCTGTGLRLFEALDGVEIATITRRCMSAATIIVMAASRIRIERRARMMLHSPTLAVHGDREDLLAGAESIATTRERMSEIIAARTKQPLRTVREWCEGNDRYFSAAEAVSVGLADEIFDEPESFPVVEKQAPADEITRVLAALEALGPVRCDVFRLSQEIRGWLATCRHLPPEQSKH